MSVFCISRHLREEPPLLLGRRPQLRVIHLAIRAHGGEWYQYPPPEGQSPNPPSCKPLYWHPPPPPPPPPRGATKKKKIFCYKKKKKIVIKKKKNIYINIIIFKIKQTKKN